MHMTGQNCRRPSKIWSAWTIDCTTTKPYFDLWKVSQILQYKMNSNSNTNTNPRSPLCVMRLIVGHPFCVSWLPHTVVRYWRNALHPLVVSVSFQGVVCLAKELDPPFQMKLQEKLPIIVTEEKGEGGKAGRRGRSSDDGEGRVQCIRTHVRTYMYQVNKGAYMHRTHVRTMALYCTRCICTYMYRTCTHTHKHIHTYILTYTHIHTCTYAHTHIRMYTPSLVRQPLPSPC